MNSISANFHKALQKLTHEAVHLDVPDHSKRFWLTVQSLCPKTERARQWLAAHGTELMIDLDRQFGD